MLRPKLEVADIFRDHGAAWRSANAGHVSLEQLKVMTAIERCRTAALGGHVERCEGCAHTVIAYTSCRNRHCPKCQGAAAREWLAERQAELLPVPYYHVVFTLPAPLRDIAYQNKAVIYDLLFKASVETVLTIAADPKHLGVRIGITAVLHTWGSTLVHHPHIHMIVPGGGISLDGQRWVACRPRFFLPVPVLAELFRGRMLHKLVAAHKAGQLQFFGKHARLAERKPLAASARYDVMTLATPEFIRRFLMHVLPSGFHRIRHYGLFASGSRADNIARARQLLATPKPQAAAADAGATDGAEQEIPAHPCPCCGGRMITIETFVRGATPHHRPTASNRAVKIDTS